MFWHYVFSNNSAQIEKLLQKEDVSLKELMEEEELLQECQAQNKKLIDFLCQDSVLLELVSLVVTEPNSDVEYQMRFKQASLAAELLSAEVPAVVDKVAASEELLSVLCKFLSNEKPLNPLLASFFSKVLGMLMNRRAEQNWYQYQVTCFRVLDYLKACPDFIPRLTHHIGTSAIMNLLHKLMCGLDEEEVRSRIHAWLSDTPLVSMLIAKLGPENEWCEQASVEQLLCDVLDSGGGNGVGAGCAGGGANSAGGGATNGSGSGSNDNGSQGNRPNILVPLIMNEATVQQLIKLLLHEQGTPSSITHVTNIIMKMLAIHSCSLCSRLPAQLDTTAASGSSGVVHLSSEDSESGKGSEEGDESSVISPDFCVGHAISDVLPQIHNMLLQPNKVGDMTECVPTSYGGTVERMGVTRLRLIALITSLVETRLYKIHCQLAELQTIPHILELFFKFPQNNFLHSLVQRLIAGLLVQESPCRTSLQQTDTVMASASSDAQQVATSSATELCDTAAALPAVIPSLTTPAAACTATPTAACTPTPAAVTCTPTTAAAQLDDTEDKKGAAVKDEQLPCTPISEDTVEKMETNSSACDTEDRTAVAPPPHEGPPPQQSPPSTTTAPAGASAEAPLVPNIPSSQLSEESPCLLAESPATSSPLGATSNSCSVFPLGNKQLTPGPVEPISSITSSSDNTWNPATTVVCPAAPVVTADSEVPEEDSHPLLCQLIREGRFVHRILFTYEYKLEDQLESESDASPPGGSLCGYRGHIRLLANILAEHAKVGPNAPLLNKLIQSLPSAVLQCWQEFLTTTLAQANALNEISPVPGPEMSHMIEDSDEDDVHTDRHIFSASHQNDNMLQITEDDLQTTKDMINAMTYSLSFDDNNGFDTAGGAASAASTDDTIAAAAASLAASAATASGDEETRGETDPSSGGMAANSAAAGSAELFEKMCSENMKRHGGGEEGGGGGSSGQEELDNMWLGREQHITFASSAAQRTDKSADEDVADGCHSSDEEGDEDEEAARTGVSRLDTSMEVDDLQDDWEAVFDRRYSDPSVESGASSGPAPVPLPMMSPCAAVTTPPADFNPWERAPSADTAGDDTSWAGFGSAAFAAGPFGGSGAPAAATAVHSHVDFGTSFGGSNPFESFQPAFPAAGGAAAAAAASGSAAAAAPAAAVAADIFAFQADFPDPLKQDGPPAVGGSSVQPVATTLDPAQNSMEMVEGSGGAASSACDPVKAAAAGTGTEDDLQTNYHFLSQLGALKSDSSSSSAPSEGSSEQPPTAALTTAAAAATDTTVAAKVSTPAAVSPAARSPEAVPSAPSEAPAVAAATTVSDAADADLVKPAEAMEVDAPSSAAAAGGASDTSATAAQEGGAPGGQ